MEISLYSRTGNNRYTVYNESLVSPHPTGHNELEYDMTLPRKTNYVDIYCN